MSVWAWHVHHEELYERLISGKAGLEKRQRYIRGCKPRAERRLRLRLLKLVRHQELLQQLHTAFFLPGATPEVRLAIRLAINRLHKIECPRCPWNGRTIFPKRKVRP